MNEEDNPSPVFPQYEPPNPNGLAMPEPGQQKPLMKLLTRRLMPKPKTRVSPVKKRLARKKKDDYGWTP